MTRMSSLALVMLSAYCCLSACAQDKTNDVTLRVVKYDALKDEVVKHRGKVVLVDLWANYCVPCKQAFPHTVDLYRKYAGKGLTVISVALDTPDEQAKNLKFLQKQNATFTNVLLDEPAEFWQKKFRTDSIPCMYIFNRQGKWTQLVGEDLAAQNLDRLVEELLAEK